MLLWKYHGLSPWKWSKNWRCFFFIEIAVSCDRKRLVILVGGIPKPSEKWWSSSVGMMKFPTEWKVIIQSYIQSCSSHHQPVIYIHRYKHIHIYIYIHIHIFMLDLKEFPMPPSVASLAASAELGLGWTWDENFQPWLHSTVAESLLLRFDHVYPPVN